MVSPTLRPSAARVVTMATPVGAAQQVAQRGRQVDAAPGGAGGGFMALAGRPGALMLGSSCTGGQAARATAWWRLSSSPASAASLHQGK